MNGEDYEARKDEHRPDWPGYKQGIQRFEGATAPDGNGRYVLYADHVAAVAEAEQLHLTHYEDGIKAERARIRAAVEAMPRTGGWTTPDGVINEVDVGLVLAIIDGDADA